MIECSRMSTPSCFARSPARDSGRTLNPIITTAVDCVPAWVAEASSTSDSVIAPTPERSEEHTSELQSQSNLVCRLLLENKKYPPPVNPTATGCSASQSFYPQSLVVSLPPFVNRHSSNVLDHPDMHRPSP